MKEAGVAQGTFYLYYPSKKDVVLALGQMVLDLVSRRMRTAYDQDASFKDTMRMVIHIAFEVGAEYKDLCRLIHFGAESVAAEFNETASHHPLQIEMTKLFRDASDAGEMSNIDPDMAVRLFFQMVPSCLQEAYVFGDGSDARALEETMAQMVLGGLVSKT